MHDKHDKNKQHLLSLSIIIRGYNISATPQKLVGGGQREMEGKRGGVSARC